MSVRVVYRCQFCGAKPGPETQKNLESLLQALMSGEYVDVEPERWLIWYGFGIWGPSRYACGHHRGELKAHLREHYGTLGSNPWAMGPHPMWKIHPDKLRARDKAGWRRRPGHAR